MEDTNRFPITWLRSYLAALNVVLFRIETQRMIDEHPEALEWAKREIRRNPEAAKKRIEAWKRAYELWPRRLGTGRALRPEEFWPFAKAHEVTAHETYKGRLYTIRRFIREDLNMSDTGALREKLGTYRLFSSVYKRELPHPRKGEEPEDEYEEEVEQEEEPELLDLIMFGDDGDKDKDEDRLVLEYPQLPFFALALWRLFQGGYVLEHEEKLYLEHLEKVGSGWGPVQVKLVKDIYDEWFMDAKGEVRFTAGSGHAHAKQLVESYGQQDQIWGFQAKKNMADKNRQRKKKGTPLDRLPDVVSFQDWASHEGGTSKKSSGVPGTPDEGDGEEAKEEAERAAAEAARRQRALDDMGADLIRSKAREPGAAVGEITKHIVLDRDEKLIEEEREYWWPNVIGKSEVLGVVGGGREGDPHSELERRDLQAAQQMLERAELIITKSTSPCDVWVQRPAQIAALRMDGWEDSEIAERLGISVATVRNHVKVAKNNRVLLEALEDYDSRFPTAESNERWNERWHERWKEWDNEQRSLKRSVENQLADGAWSPDGTVNVNAIEYPYLTAEDLEEGAARRRLQAPPLGEGKECQWKIAPENIFPAKRLHSQDKFLRRAGARRRLRRARRVQAERLEADPSYYDFAARLLETKTYYLCACPEQKLLEKVTKVERERLLETAWADLRKSAGWPLEGNPERPRLSMEVWRNIWKRDASAVRSLRQKRLVEEAWRDVIKSVGILVVSNSVTGYHRALRAAQEQQKQEIWKNRGRASSPAATTPTAAATKYRNRWGMLETLGIFVPLVVPLAGGAATKYRKMWGLPKKLATRDQF